MNDILLVALSVLGLGFLLLVFSKGGGDAGQLPVTAKPLLTKREREAMAALREALPRHGIYPQVAMGALLKPKPGLPVKKRASVRNAFSQKIVDFVLEDPDTGELIIVEVDDATHNAAKDKRRDAMTATAGYRTVRIPKNSNLSADSVRALILSGNASAGDEIGKQEPKLQLNPTQSQA